MIGRKTTLLFIFAAYGALAFSGLTSEAQAQKAKRPNVLLIVADDMGYSDLGSFGGEISTPNLDALAQRGVRLTNFHAAPSCSPTRAMLMSGCDNHTSGIGAMVEQIKDPQEDKPGYEGYLNQRVAALPSLLKDSGYHTYMAGKWHLGLEEETSPQARGFEQSFALLVGGGSHFDISGTTSEEKVSPYRENDKKVESLPDDFFSTKYYTDKMLEYIESNRGDDKPFFGWLAYTAPHWPLQAPDQYMKKYEGKYDAGFDVLRDARLKQAAELGLTLPGYDPSTFFRSGQEWNQLDDQQRKVLARKMEIYAAMVDNMDHHIGRVVEYLKKTGQLDNTYIIFMSDNGADGGDVDRAGGPFSDFISENVDNSFENLGHKGSFTSKGRNWAQASMAPFKLWKGFTTEGGIRVPAIIYNPTMDRGAAIDRQLLTAMDVAPTILELAGAKHPGRQYKGREVVPMQGKSFAGLFAGEAEVHAVDEPIGWELHGRRALFMGDWKAVSQGRPFGNNQWEIYNLKEDPSEINNQAQSRPDMLQKLSNAWDSYAKTKGVVLIEDTPPGRSGGGGGRGQGGQGQMAGGQGRGGQGGQGRGGQGGGGQGRGQGQGGQGGVARRQPLIGALDTDGDFEITDAEMRNAAASILALDANKDGQLTEDEYRGQRPDQGQGGQGQGRQGGGPPQGGPPQGGQAQNGIAGGNAAPKPSMPARSGEKIYVSANAAGGGNGAGWQSAYNSLADALNAASSGDEIRVAKGTYYPSANNDRAAAFQLKEDVTVLGGFSGSGDERDWEQNVTHLSGDIGEAGNDEDNSHHVVIGAEGATLDGFLISGGNGLNARGGGGGGGQGGRGPGAGGRGRGQGGQGRGPRAGQQGGRGPGGPGGPGGQQQGGPGNAGGPAIHITPQMILGGISPGQGAGIVNFKCAPTYRNCIIRDNKARKGAGAYNMTSLTSPADPEFAIQPAPEFINCSFINNFAAGRGGAISNDLGTEPTFIQCTFTDNKCDGKGGAVYNDFRCSPTFISCLFTGNSAYDGGALGNDGASSPTITNCTFYGNHAIDMGAALYQGSGPSNNPVVTNTIIWGNTCDNGPAEIVNWHDNSPVVTFSCIEGGYAGHGNTESDPMFVDPANGDFSLAANSPCIDAGDGLAGPVNDRSDKPRFDDTGIPNGNVASIVAAMGDLGRTARLGIAPIDIGAFERQSSGSTKKMSVVYVDAASTGDQDGQAWGSAFKTLQPAIELAYRAKAEVWVAKGTYKPTDGLDRTASIQLRDKVAVFGGFDGSEQTRDQRDPAANATMLSGDIGAAEYADDNSYHVLIGADEASLDGFVIAYGNANGQAFHAKGGGMINYAQHKQKAPTGWATGLTVHVSNCLFVDNQATEGGAVYNYDRNEPTFTNVNFERNHAESGGAILDRVGVKSKLTNCNFTDNYAKWRGGAVYFDYGSRPTIEGCSFKNNKTDGLGGATYIISRASQLENTIVSIRNSVFEANVARLRGGAISNADSGVLDVADSEFTNNRATGGGGAISNEYLSRATTKGLKFSGNQSETGEADINTDETSTVSGS